MDTIRELGTSLDRFQLVSASGPSADIWWALAAPLFLEGAAEWERFLDLDDIHHELVAGRFRLWMALDGEGVTLALLTSEEEYPKRKVLRLLWMGGSELKSALPMLEIIELWAARRGVRTVEVLGRRAWARVLRPYGYAPRSVLVTKDLTRVKEH